MWIYIVMCIIILLILYIFITYNGLVRLNNTAKKTFSTMDVYLKKRWDLIPNLVESVKKYVKHEQKTLQEVVKLRNINYDNINDNEKIKINESLAKGISQIMILVEDYPNLKANKNFIDLSNQLSKIEEDIANARKIYNANVRNFNNKVEMFPSNIIAKAFNFDIKLFFGANEKEKKDVKVKL